MCYTIIQYNAPHYTSDIIPRWAAMGMASHWHFFMSIATLFTCVSANKAILFVSGLAVIVC